MTKAKAAEPEKHVLDESLYEDADKLLAITVGDEVPDVNRQISLLALARDGIRRLDAEYKLKTLKLAAQIKPFADQRAGLKKKLDKVEAFAVEKLAAFIKTQGVAALPAENDKGVKLSPVANHKYTVTRDDLTYGEIPAQYRLPAAQCIDWTKVAEAHSNKGKLPDFVKIETTYVLRTKLPEVEDE
jgi:hypothetical protein